MLEAPQVNDGDGAQCQVRVSFNFKLGAHSTLTIISYPRTTSRGMSHPNSELLRSKLQPDVSCCLHSGLWLVQSILSFPGRIPQVFCAALNVLMEYRYSYPPSFSRTMKYGWPPSNIINECSQTWQWQQAPRCPTSHSPGVKPQRWE